MHNVNFGFFSKIITFVTYLIFSCFSVHFSKRKPKVHSFAWLKDTLTIIKWFICFVPIKIFLGLHSSSGWPNHLYGVGADVLPKKWAFQWPLKMPYQTTNNDLWRYDGQPWIPKFIVYECKSLRDRSKHAAGNRHQWVPYRHIVFNFLYCLLY